VLAGFPKSTALIWRKYTPGNILRRLSEHPLIKADKRFFCEKNPSNPQIQDQIRVQNEGRPHQPTRS
jgi:hypothetical protein